MPASRQGRVEVRRVAAVARCLPFGNVTHLALPLDKFDWLGGAVRCQHAGVVRLLYPLVTRWNYLSPEVGQEWPELRRDVRPVSGPELVFGGPNPASSTLGVASHQERRVFGVVGCGQAGNVGCRGTVESRLYAQLGSVNTFVEAVVRMVLYRKVSVVVDRHDHRCPHAAVTGVPRFVSHLKVVPPEPFGLHEVHSPCAPFAALLRNFHWVSDHPPRYPAARLDGGKYLADRPVHDHIYLTLGRRAQPSGLCLRRLGALFHHVADPLSSLQESPERVTFLEELGYHRVFVCGVRVDCAQLDSELR